MARRTSVLFFVTFALLVLLLSGCGGGTGLVAPGGATGASVHPLAITSLSLFDAGATPGDYRWGDIAGNVYRGTYKARSDYGAATVTVTFDDASTTTLSGTITATGLKPNFAYQMKLEGEPSVDAWGNEQIGYLGRWWSTIAGNVSDDYYQSHSSQEEILGYLVFGFFITDGSGAVTDAPFRVDSSYHVLWNEDQPGAPQLSSRGPAQSWAPVWSAAAYGSKKSFISATQTIFPEIQSGRPAPGQALLPAGSYHCAFVITEESFHDYYAGGGNWAAAMRNDSLVFTVGGAAASHDVAITGISVPKGKIAANQDATVTVTVANKGSATETSLSVSLTDQTTGAVVDTASVDSLAAGGSTDIPLTWHPTVTGKHTLEAAVEQVSGETNIGNNALTKSVRVTYHSVALGWGRAGCIGGRPSRLG